MELYYRDKHFLLEDNEELNTDNAVDTPTDIQSDNTSTDNTETENIPNNKRNVAKPIDIDKQLTTLVQKGKSDGLNIIPYAKQIWNNEGATTDSSINNQSNNNQSNSVDDTEELKQHAEVAKKNASNVSSESSNKINNKIKK